MNKVSGLIYGVKTNNLILLHRVVFVIDSQFSDEYGKGERREKEINKDKEMRGRKKEDKQERKRKRR